MQGMKNSFLIIRIPKIEKYSNVLHVNGVVQRKVNEILPRFLPLYCWAGPLLTLKFNNSLIFSSSHSLDFFQFFSSHVP